MSRKNPIESCLVVGAGIAGLLAARTLQDHGVRVVVLDKGRGVGGRIATRRIGQAVFDHGAQFFTVRSQRFGWLVEQWLASGLAREWSRGFASGEKDAQMDGHPRYCGVTGMTAIAKHLAGDLNVLVGERVVGIRKRGRRWVVATKQGRRLAAEALILTPPVPQSLTLLDAVHEALPVSIRASLGAISYDPCLALMTVLDGPSRVAEPGGMALSGEPIAWMADNYRKGISPRAGVVTIHAGPAFSRRHWDTDGDTIAQLLLRAAERWLGSNVNDVQVHRWRYSQPAQGHPEPCVFVAGPPPLVFAGDAFGGPRVEGAALSGLASAEWLLRGGSQRG